MSVLTISWDADEILAVETALKTLFKVQGYKGSDEHLTENVGLLANELSKRRSPVKAILAGLHELKFEDVSKINLFLIENAAKRHIEQSQEHRIDCDYCSGSGVVTMRNKDKYQFSLACVCINGDTFAVQGNRRWNGERFQEGRHGTYELDFADILLKNK